VIPSVFLRSLRVPRLYTGILLVCLLAPLSAPAHDPSAYGGLFRSRNFGQTWLNADVGLFLSAAVSLAVNPADPMHLLMGTDASLLGSRNGGRSWEHQAPDKLFGAVFAVLFLPDGKSAICSTPGGIFRWHAGEWQQSTAPKEAAPARAIAGGADPGRVYIAGRGSLFRSDDGGVEWNRIESDLPGEVDFSGLAVSTAPQETLYAVISGKPMASADQGLTWRARDAGLPDAAIEALNLDPAVPGRLWTAANDHIYRSDDGAITWRPFGKPLPDTGISVRGIAADAQAMQIVITTHRGLYRSSDGAQTWALAEDNLPVHLEARPLVRDPSHAGTLYAGYSLVPYGEIWRIAVEGGNLLSKVDLLSLVGALAFLVLLTIVGVLVTRWLIRQRLSAALPVRRETK
jgi:photosystem II stability/assembly factor-like uncharacterized protein